MKTTILAALLVFGAAASRAQQDERAQPGLGDPLRAAEELDLAEENLALPSFELEPRQKFMFGADGYRSGETDLFLLLPLDFTADLNWSWYKSDFSSITHTLAIGGGKEWDSKYAGVTYTATPWANDYRSDSLNVKISMRSGPKDFRTTLGADVTVTHHTQVVRFPNVSGRLDVTQRTPTISVRQQLWGDTRLSVDLSESTYNKNLALATLQLTVVSLRNPAVAANFGNASGLMQGFQDRSMRFGFSQDFKVGKIPVSAWASYQNTHFVDTFQSPDGAALVFVQGQTADQQSYGVDAEITSLFSAGLQYQRIRQSYYPTRDYWGFNFGVRL